MSNITEIILEKIDTDVHTIILESDNPDWGESVLLIQEYDEMYRVNYHDGITRRNFSKNTADD